MKVNVLLPSIDLFKVGLQVTIIFKLINLPIIF